MEIISTYVSERVRFEGVDADTIIGTAIDDAGVEFAVKGREDMKERLARGQRYFFVGDWQTYRNRAGIAERQFVFAFYIQAEWAEACRDVLSILSGRGFPRAVAKEIVRQWGGLSADTIRKNPFLLLKFKGCGFKRCDSLWLEMGKPPDVLKRQLLCGLHRMLDTANGSTWHPRTAFAAAIKSSIAGVDPDVDAAIRLGVRAGLLSVQHTDPDTGEIDWDTTSRSWVAWSLEADQERQLARWIGRAMNEPQAWPGIRQGSLTPHQYEQLRFATQANVGLLLGGGGVGKTYTVARLLQCLLSAGYGSESIALCAPTGKAAVRLTEQISEAGISGMRCRTYHSLLGVGGNGGFGFNADNPLPVQAIIGDETSMVDLSLMHSLFAARPTGCPVLLVGDPYQLPPVGSGAPFRDLAQVLPAGELTEIRRNSGTVALAGGEIRRGLNFHVDSRIELPEKNLTVVSARSTTDQIAAMFSAIDEAAGRGFDPVWGVQVLGLVNRKSELAVETLNQALQDRLNGGRAVVPGCKFRLCDKAMNTANGWLLPARKYADKIGSDVASEDATVNRAGQIYVANGEQGQVVDIQRNHLVVRMETPQRFVMVPIRNVEEGSETGATGCDFQLAYAITAHKSQGSQFPVVIGMIDEYYGAKRIADRAMWYTIISRTKSYCVLIGNLDAVYGACRRASIDQRKTFLKELLGWTPAEMPRSIAHSRC